MLIIDAKKTKEILRPPASMDPHDFYGDKYKTLVANAQGVERLVYAYIPFSVIKSLALAIDPLRKFRAVANKITTVNRTRKRTKYSILQQRSKLVHYVGRIDRSLPNYCGLGCFGPIYTTPYGGDTTTALSGQPAFPTTTKDTTSRTRPAGSDLGEFEHSSYRIESPGRSQTKTYRACQTSYTAHPSLDYFLDTYTRTVTISGPGAWMSTTNLGIVESEERTFTTSLMSSNVVGMLKDLLPTSRRYSLLRNVIELKDLPHSILSLQKTIRDFSSLYGHTFGSSSFAKKASAFNKVALKDVPNEYLSYQFGWRQIYQDLVDLVVRPKSIAREINFLMKRNGQAQTYRRKKEIFSTPATIPTFNYDNLNDEIDVVQSVRGKRRTELRMVINTIFDFPPIDVPDFKRRLFLQKLGALPTYTDLYNLTPWSWLLDWFTGLGNYVQAMDTINNDPSLINWGFLTGYSESERITGRSSNVKHLFNEKHNGVITIQEPKSPYRHESRLVFNFQSRKSLTNAYSVKSTVEVANLSPFQQSILGAIVAQRTNTRRGPK